MTQDDLREYLQTHSDLIPSHLSDSSSLNLLYTLATQDEAVAASYHQLEACHLVHHSFRLCQDVSKALKVLQVKGQDDELLARSRLALFASAKNVLNENMRLLGLIPLDQM